MNGVRLFLNAPQRTWQFLIWALAALVVVGGLGIAGSAPGDPLPGATAGVEAPATPAGSGVLLGEGVQHVASGTTVPTLTGSAELLPAWRWQGAIGTLPSNFGLKDTGSSVATGLGEFMFSTAATVWSLLLTVVKFAVGSDIVTTFAGTINALFSQVFGSLDRAHIPLIVAAGAFLLLATRLVNARTRNRAISAMLSMFVVLGTLQALGTAAQADSASSLTPGSPSATATVPKGTPAWLALKGNDYVTEVATTATTLFGATGGVLADIQSGTSGSLEDTRGGATCTYYIQQLSAINTAKASASGSATDKSAATTMSMVSYMWQRALYDPWVRAAYGDNFDGGRVACHYLENQAGVTSADQAAIAKSGNKSPYAGINTKVFASEGDVKDQEAKHFRWAACADSANWREGWGDLPTAPKNGCSTWWNKGDTEGFLKFDDDGHLHKDTLGESSSEATQAVYNMIMASWGHNGGERLAEGFWAMANSLAYVGAFGAPAIGVLLAQLMVLFSLILLPWTLLMLALPSKNGMNPFARKMLMMTAQAFGGKILFLVVLGVTLTVMSVLFSFTSSWGVDAVMSGAAAATVRPSGSAAASFVTLLIPVATLFAMKKVLKSVGMGNLMGLGGVAGYTRAATKGATGADRKGKAGKTMSTAKGMASSGRDKLKGAALSGLKAAGGKASGAAQDRFYGRRYDNTKDGVDADLRAAVAMGDLTKFEALRTQDGRDKERSEANAREEKISELEKLGIARADAERMVDNGLTPEQAGLAKAELDELRGEVDLVPAGAPGETAENPFNPMGSMTPEEAERLAAERTHRLAQADETATSDDPLSAAAGQKELDNNLISEFGDLVAATRTDGEVGPLTGAQVHAAEIAAQDAVSPELRNDVLVGDSGAPPMLGPTLSPDGTINISARDLENNAQLAAEVLSNSANLLPPEVLVRMPDESRDDYHARLTMAKLETGLVSPSGLEVDVLARLNLDPDALDFQDRVIEMAVRATHDPSVLEQAAVRMSTEQLANVDNGMRRLNQTSPDSALRRTESDVAHVERAMSSLAKATADSMAEALSSIEAMKGAASTPQSDEAARALMAAVEQKVVPQLEKNLAAGVDANYRLPAASERGGELAAQRGHVEEQFKTLASEIKTALTDVRLSGAEDLTARLATLEQSVARALKGTLSEATSTMEHVFGELTGALEANADRLSTLSANPKHSDPPLR